MVDWKRMCYVTMASVLMLGLLAGCGDEGKAESKVEEKKEEEVMQEKTPLQVFQQEMKKLKGEEDMMQDNGDGSERYTYYVPLDNGDYNFYALNIQKGNGAIVSLEFSGNTSHDYLLPFLELAETLELSDSLVEDVANNTLDQNQEVEVERDEYYDNYGYMTLTPIIDIDSKEDEYADNETMISDLLQMINQKEGIVVKLLSKENNGYTTLYTMGIAYPMDDFETEAQFSVDIEVENNKVGIGEVSYMCWNEITKDMSDDVRIVIETIIEMMGTPEDIRDFQQNFSDTMDITIPLDNGKQLEIHNASHGGVEEFYIY